MSINSFTAQELKDLAKEIHSDAIAKGWYDVVDGRTVLDAKTLRNKTWLQICELAEAYEEYRRPELEITDTYTKDGKPEGFVIEMADALIRCLDLVEAFGISHDLDIPSQRTSDEDIESHFLNISSHLCSIGLGDVHHVCLTFTVEDIIHFCDVYKLPLKEAVATKMAFNKTRPFRHGGKRA